MDYKGKCIKYVDENGLTVCVNVEYESENTIRHSEYAHTHLFSGLGFSYDFSGENYHTTFNWSYWYELYIYANDSGIYKNKFDNVEIISEDEFDEIFNACMKKMNRMHYLKPENIKS